MDTEDISNNQLPVQSNRIQNQFIDSKPVMVSAASLKHDLKWRNVARDWIRRLDPLEPVMPFTKPLIPDKLAAAGIVPPTNASKPSGTARSTPFCGRIVRGGRIYFDRWNPLMHTPVNCGDSFCLSPSQQPSPRFG